MQPTNRTLLLLGGLVAALGLWLWSRTRTGEVLIVDALEQLTRGPRGIRNNNPGNIDWIETPAKRWRGMYRQETPEEGGRFGVFDKPENGVRAIGKELLRAVSRGARSVDDLIAGIPQADGSRFDAWAPAHENNTPAYVRFVARALRVDPDDAIDVRSYLPRLAAAIVQHENGVQPYSMDELNEWVYLA